MANEKKKKYTRLELMAEAPVRGAIIKLAIPTILSQIMSLVYSMVSTYCLGHMGEAASAQVAAVTLATPVTMVIQAVGNIFATGASPFISRHLGAGDIKTARRASSTAFWTAGGLSVLTVLLFFIIREPVLRLIGTNAETYQSTKEYLTIITGFSFMQVLSTACSGTVRSEGGTKESMIGMGGGGIVNAILTPLFIFSFGWGIKGAAWAQVGAHFYTLGYFVSVFVRGRSTLSINPKDFKPSLEIYWSIIKFGIPSALSNVLMSLTGIMGNRMAGTFGTHVIAAQGVVGRISMIAYMMNFGFCLGYQPFCTYNYGARNFQRMKEAFKVSIIYSTSIGIVIGLLLLIIPQQLVGIFVDDPEVIAAATIIARWLALAIPFTGSQNTFMYTAQALDKPVRAMLITLGRQILYVPFLYLLSNAFGLTGFAAVQPCCDILITAIGAAIILPVFRRVLRDGLTEKEARDVKEDVEAVEAAAELADAAEAAEEAAENKAE